MPSRRRSSSRRFKQTMNQTMLHLHILLMTMIERYERTLLELIDWLMYGYGDPRPETLVELKSSLEIYFTRQVPFHHASGVNYAKKRYMSQNRGHTKIFSEARDFRVLDEGNLPLMTLNITNWWSVKTVFRQVQQWKGKFDNNIHYSANIIHPITIIMAGSLHHQEGPWEA